MYGCNFIATEHGRDGQSCMQKLCMVCISSAGCVVHVGA